MLKFKIFGQVLNLRQSFCSLAAREHKGDWPKKDIFQVEKSNVYNIKSSKGVKGFFFTYKPLLLKTDNKAIAANKLVDIFDCYLKVALKKEGKNLKEVTEESFFQELLGHIQRDSDKLNYKSLFKILDQALTNRKKIFGEVALYTMQTYNFSNFISHIPELKQFLDVLHYLDKMRELMRIKNESEAAEKKFYTFFKSILARYKSKKFPMSSYSPKEAVSLLVYAAKANFRNFDLFFDTTEVLKNERELRACLNVFWASAKLNLYNEACLKSIAGRILLMSDENFVNEIKNLGKMYFNFLILFLSRGRAALLLPSLGEKVSRNFSLLFDDLSFKEKNFTIDEHLYTAKFCLLNKNKKYSMLILKDIKYELEKLSPKQTHLVFDLVEFYYKNETSFDAEERRLLEQIFSKYFEAILAIKLHLLERALLVMMQIFKLENLIQNEFFKKNKTAIKEKYLDFILSPIAFVIVFQDFHFALEYLKVLAFIRDKDPDAYHKTANSSLANDFFVRYVSDGKHLKYRNDFLLNFLLVADALHLLTSEVFTKELVGMIEEQENVYSPANDLQSMFYNCLLLKYEVRAKPFAVALKNKIYQNQHLVEEFFKRVKEAKPALFIERNKIFSHRFYFDLYVPSLKLGITFLTKTEHVTPDDFDEPLGTPPDKQRDLLLGELADSLANNMPEVERVWFLGESHVKLSPAEINKKLNFI